MLIEADFSIFNYLPSFFLVISRYFPNIPKYPIFSLAAVSGNVAQNVSAAQPQTLTEMLLKNNDNFTS